MMLRISNGGPRAWTARAELSDVHGHIQGHQHEAMWGLTLYLWCAVVAIRLDTGYLASNTSLANSLRSPLRHPGYAASAGSSLDWWVIVYSASHKAREDVDRFVREFEPLVGEPSDPANHSERVVIKSTMVVDVPGPQCGRVDRSFTEDLEHRFYAQTQDTVSGLSELSADSRGALPDVAQQHTPASNSTAADPGADHLTEPLQK